MTLNPQCFADIQLYLKYELAFMKETFLNLIIVFLFSTKFSRAPSSDMFFLTETYKILKISYRIKFLTLWTKKGNLWSYVRVFEVLSESKHLKLLLLYFNSVNGFLYHVCLLSKAATFNDI